MNDALIRRMIQVGTVTAVSGLKARVLFKESGMTSGWLSVCQDNGTPITTTTVDGHSHGGSTGAWVPNINDTVLVFYPAIPNSDGYIVKRIPS